MEVDAAASPQSYTILRIKRKRNEEPLDALVVESRVRRKKSRGGVGVFQYAHTVENDAWTDEKSQKDIQDKISRLAKEDATKLNQKPPTPNGEPGDPPSPTRGRKDPPPRYTIVAPEEQEPPAAQRTTSAGCPMKELAQNPPLPDFRMYDAILSKKKLAHANELDLEMEKFLPLLNDYLKIHDFNPSQSPRKIDTLTDSTNSRPSVPDDGAGDYVWDVFIHRPATLSEWNSVAARTGTLTGLPLSVLESDESTSGSEAEDEADEDSNAEEYYKNDYPDEEDSDSEPDNSDEFHEESEYDDLLNYQDDEEDF